MVALRLALFGGFCLSNVATEAVPVATKKARALLAFLALHPGEPQARSRLAGLLWGDSGEPQARLSLRQTLSMLRRALDTPDARALATTSDTVALGSASIAVDVAEFHQLVTGGNHEDLERAAALYRGDLLDGFSVHAPEFEDWLTVERQRRREQMLNVLMKLLTHHRATDALEQGISVGTRLVALDPLNEVAHRNLMDLFRRQGRSVSALRQYRVCADALMHELGIEPGIETTALWREISGERRALPNAPASTPRPLAEDAAGIIADAAQGLRSAPSFRDKPVARSEPSQPWPPNAERQQLTVLSCEEPVAEVAAAMEWPKPGLAQPSRPSIAVLPFVNMSGDPEQEYFADGMVEDVITGLSRVKWLFVIARNSSFAYRGRAVDVKQVGRELGVRYVLEGSVRKVASRVRISGQLVEAENGRHLWADRYDRDLTDVFALQDEITISVVAAIEPNLRQAEIERIRRKRPDNLDAYDLLLRALPSVYTCMPEGAAKALLPLEQALAIEPTYALAHGFAAWAHEIIYVRGGMGHENYDGALRHAHAALEYGRGDAMALALSGFAIGMVAHDRKVALEAFEAALALSASCAFVYSFGCAPVAFGGDAERAIDWGQRAIRLSPLDAMNYIPQGIIGFGNFLLGRHEEAVVAGRRAVQLNPGFSLLHGWLAAPLAKLGRIEEAKAASARLLALHPGFSSSGWCVAVGVAPRITGTVIDAMRRAGLPE